MAFVYTYNSLVTDVTNYIQRADTVTVAEIPIALSKAESRIAREVKPRGFETYVLGTVANGSALVTGKAVYQKPDRWRRTISMYYGAGTNDNASTVIKERTLEYCKDYAPDGTVKGPPVYFADYGFNNWLIVPTPDQNYPWLIGYYQRLQPLDSQYQTNWLTEYAPDFLLAAVMCEMSAFLKNQNSPVDWEAKYQAGATALRAEDVARYADRETVPTTGGP